MLIEIARAVDFYRVVSPAHDRLCTTPADEDDLLEVVLSPGNYEAINLSLGDGIETRPIDLIFRAADPERPPVLHDLTFSLTGRSVRLEGLVFAHARSGGPILRLAVTAQLSIERCALVDGASLASSDGHLLELVAIGGDGRATATVHNSWFIQNWTGDGGAMVICVTAPPHFFHSMDIHNVAFVDNHAAVSIAPGATSILQFTDCVAFEPTDPEPSTTSAPVFVTVDPTHTQVNIDRGVMIAQDLEHLIGRRSRGQQPAASSHAVNFRDSQLVLRRPFTVDQPPAGFVFTRTLVTGWAGGAAQGDRLAAVADAVVARVEHGEPPQPALLAAALLGSDLTAR
jgi:hypothetical protein